MSLAKDRRSVREFTSAPVDFALVVEVIRAATYAPSAGDLQPWRFVVVTDDAVKQSLVSACPQQSWMSTASLFVVVLAESGRVVEYYGDRGREWAVQSVAAAVQNLLLAAQDLGLGACWVGSFDANSLRDLLRVPDGIDLFAVVALGPSREVPGPKTIAPLDQYIYFHVFGEKTEDMSVVLRDWGEYLRKRSALAREAASEQVVGVRESAQGFFARARDRLRRQR